MKHSLYIYAVLLIFMITSCQDFLETTPNGQVSASGATEEGAEGLVVAAYAGIVNDDMIGPITSMWAYGSVRSDDAYKGGGGVSDVADINFLEQYNLTNPSQEWMHPYTWELLYSAISRANSALRTLNELSSDTYAERNTRIAEMRFLRGHSHFVLKKLFKSVPYIDESLSNGEILQVSNVDLTNDELWDKIAADFDFAMQNLPTIQTEAGRANKYAAAAYLAKTRLFQAYEQSDENSNAVTSINTARMQEVVTLTDMVINSGQYALQADFAENFLDGYDNDMESIFAAQFSISDGTSVGRLSFVTGLNYPHGAPQYGCCGFHAPSHNLVNAFATESGLPKHGTFNDVTLTPEDITPTGQTMDPRIDHTVGINNHPYKYQTGDYIFSDSWVRDAGVYGRFHSMKEQQAADCSCYKKEGPFIGTSKNIDFIRYADVLLWKAEALIELNQDLLTARDIINLIRQRASQSTSRTRLDDGTPASNYNIAEYTDANYTWTQASAREALRFERRLEFATEGQRFFDLVRWGIAAETLNAYLDKEKTRRDFLSSAKFTANRDEYYPIPQREINFTKGLYTQNIGY